MNTQHRLGQHYTSENKLVENHSDVLIENKDKIILDPFCGEGHLLKYFLSLFPEEEQLEIVKSKKILGFDIFEHNIKKVREYFKNRYNLEDKLLEEIFQVRDSFIKKSTPDNCFIFTNPPYLAKNVCQRNFRRDFNKYFVNRYKEFNDYFEIALILYSRLPGIWITPANLFSSTIMKTVRKEIISKIDRIYIFEEKTFMDTDISATTFLIQEKSISSNERDVVFVHGEHKTHKKFNISEEGNFVQEWEDIKNTKNRRGILQGYIDKRIRKGEHKVLLIDTDYKEREFHLSPEDKKALELNTLILRTTDTGKDKGKLGLYTIKELWNSEAIGLVTKKTSRVYSQIFIDIPIQEQLILKEKFNSYINELREKNNSIFLTNYKNSNEGKQRKRISFKEAFSLMNYILDK